MDGDRQGGGGARPYFDPRTQHDPMQSKILACQTLEELTNIILLDNFEFNLVHCSTAFNKFGVFRKDKPKLSPREQGALRALLELAKGKQFLPRQASIIIRAVAVGSLHEENKECLSLIEALIDQESFSQWRPMEIAHTLDALSALKLRPDQFFARIEQDLSKRKLDTFNAQDIVCVLNGFVDSRIPARTLFESFARELQSRDLRTDLKDKRKGEESNIFTLQRLVSILCSLAQAECTVDTVLLDKLAHELATRPLKHLKPSELCNVAWAFTVLGYQPRNAFARLVPEVDTKRARLTYPQLATIAWAFATVRLDAPEQVKRLFETVSRELKNRKEKDATSEAMANVVWAFAQAGVNSQMLLVKIANDLVQHRSELEDFTPHQLAHMAWGFAQANFRHSTLYETIAKAVGSRELSDFKPNELALVAWALAASNTQGLDALNERCEDEILARGLHSFSNKDFADVLWALAHMHVRSRRVETGIRDAVAIEIRSRGISSFKPREMCTLLSAYAGFGWNDSSLFEQVADSLVTQTLDKFSTHDLANLVSSFALLGFVSRALFDRVCAVCASRGFTDANTDGKRASAGGCSSSDVILICYSLACNQHLYSSYAIQVLGLSAPSIAVHDRTPQNAQMLTQAVVAWKQAHPDEALPLLLVELQEGGWMESQAHTAAGIEEDDDVRQQVSKSLQNMGYVHLLDNFRTADGISTSIRLTNNVVVEVLDPNAGAFLIDRKTIRGSTAFKQRLLEMSGFWVLSITTLEWRALSAGKEGDEVAEQAAREAFLQAKLNNLAS